MSAINKDKITIRFATENDIPTVMQFIDTYWKKGHILGNNKELFCYEWLKNGKVSVAIALNGEEIVGMEGFIPYGEKNRDIMMTLWKVIKTGNPLLGMAILDFIKNNADVKTISSPGINAKTVELYQYLGYETGKMTQWYRLNSHIAEYKIAAVKNKDVPETLEGKCKLLKFTDFATLAERFSFADYYATNPCPLKEAWYVEHRYFRHPIYKYDVYGIADGASTNCRILLVFRVQEAQGNRCLRLVDVIGDTDLMYQVTTAIDELLQRSNLEYADFYEKGMDGTAMEKAGWRKVEGSGNVIPNYFAPFVQENIDIIYFTSEPAIKLFKADGDQDRPS